MEEKTHEHWPTGKAEILWQKRLLINYNQTLEEVISLLPQNMKIMPQLFDYKTSKKGQEEVNLGLARLTLDPSLERHGLGPTHVEAKAIISKTSWLKAGVYENIYLAKYLHEVRPRDFIVLALKDQFIRMNSLKFASTIHCYSRNAGRIGDICLDDIARYNNIYYLLVEKKEEK